MSCKNKLQLLFDEYIKECQFSSRLSFATIRGYTEVFRLFSILMPEITEPRLLTTEMLIEFFKRLETRERVVGKNTIKVGVKNSTINTYYNKLKSFLGWLHSRNLIEENPINRIKPPELNYGDERALDEDSIRKLYSAITLHSKDALILRRDIAMLSLFVFTGVRSGEFISLEVSNIDFEKKFITVRGQTSKSRRTRIIPIHPTLLYHLREYISERNKRRYQTQYLIVSKNRDQGLTNPGLKHWVKNLQKKSGIKFHVHRFRHSFACNLAKNDVNAAKIQKLLGHSSLDMTMRYLRSISTEDLKNDINRLSF